MKYDSEFEKKLHKSVLKNCEYHTDKVKWYDSQLKKYTPDFVYRAKDIDYYIEAKGRFRTMAEAAKYVEINRTLILNAIEQKYAAQLVFLFMYPDKPLPGAKRRKDGTIRTHAEWADKHGIPWYTKDTIGKIVGNSK